MRASEFVSEPVREDKTVEINIPITITIPSGDEPAVVTQQQTKKSDDDDIMVTPLQQEVEISKAMAGKKSPIITQLTQDEEDNESAQEETDLPLSYR